MRINEAFKKILSLPDDPNIHQDVRHHFKHNFIVNLIDSAFFLLGDSFVSTYTIIAVFASTLTDSPLLIGLIPALTEAGWFIPQLFMAGYVQRLHKKMPFARLMAAIERTPFILLPFVPFLLHWISKELVLILFLIVIVWRGLSSGMVALIWQEVIAIVMPAQVRSRYFGFSHTTGKILGIFGAGATSLILAKISYPNNYALSFFIGGIFIWVSFIYFARTIEPVHPKLSQKPQGNSALTDFTAYKAILREDKNFVRYLLSRIIMNFGRMANAFFAVYGIHRFNLAEGQAGVFTALVFVSGTLGFFVFGLVGDRIGPHNTLFISDLMQVLMMLLAFLSPGVWAIYTIFFIFGFSQSASMVGDLVIGMELGPDEKRPSYMGMARTIPGLIILVSPLIGGVLVKTIDYQPMFLIALVFSLIGSVLVLGLEGRKSILIQEKFP